MIYTRDNLGELAWPAAAAGYRPMLAALVGQGPRAFIANCDAEAMALPAGAAVLPLAVVDREPPRPNAYVCSPTTHYIDYARREIELELAGQPLLRRALPPIIAALRPLMRWSSVERAAYVNNWLLSTNLYPDLGADQLAAIRDGLLAAFPGHTIIFRSLCAGLNAPLIARLRALGFRAVFSRQVYLLDPRDGAFRRRNNYAHDRRLARRSPYRRLGHHQLGPGDAPRLRALYDELYLDKYSPYNPQFTDHYVAAALAGGWLDFSALERDGRIDGLLGTVELHGLITAPLVGYDRAVGQAAGLYRLLMLELVERAAERGLMLHLSSGAASFKRLRGAEPQVEYSLVYHRHLPPRQRLPWLLLEWLSRRAIIPLMERYAL